MKLTIQDKHIAYYGGECGIYKNDTPLSLDYAAMDMTLLVNAINDLPKDKAIAAVTKLRDTASEQIKWESTPQNIGFPLLIRRPSPTPINEVRKNIENTVKFTEEVLRALKGE